MNKNATKTEKISHAKICTKFLIYELINNDRISLSGRINLSLLSMKLMSFTFFIFNYKCQFDTFIYC